MNIDLLDPARFYLLYFFNEQKEDVLFFYSFRMVFILRFEWEKTNSGHMQQIFIYNNYI